ncbi:glycopeptide antibiotics resistance protein [Streptomyces sp. 3330]|uniref:VanZ family protein n=1 Tax=Streptomyces sp. 3330 TaxID=2817755 RepID=UPI002858DDAA|nr:VanZ family protein [Streptomyces sp. 3330]MDR6978101.1 glycopeptide antibiotics resistance protein [Streptomyces sp. 3330]
MARAALRPLAVFRPRATRTEEPAPPRNGAGKSGPKRGFSFKPRAKAGPKPGSGSGAKAGSKPVPSKKAARAERRPLPLPLRLLAMLCAFAFMVAFAVVLARLTLEPSPASAALIHSNLRPGDSLRAYLDQPELRDAVKQIGGNVLLGVPFGVLVPVVAPRARGLLRVLLLTATVMLMVEFAQGAVVTGRAFDIDDVILNTTGALIGYLLIGRRMSRAVHARERHLRRGAREEA